MKIKSSLGEETVDLMPRGIDPIAAPADYQAQLPTGNDVVRHFNRVVAKGAEGDVTCTLTAEEAGHVRAVSPTKMVPAGDGKYVKVPGEYPRGLKLATAKE